MMTGKQCRVALAGAGYKSNEISVRYQNGRAPLLTIWARVAEWVVRDLCPGAEIQYAALKVNEAVAQAAIRVVGILPVGSEVTCQIACASKMPAGGPSCDLRSPDRYRLIRAEADLYCLECWGGHGGDSPGSEHRGVSPEGRWEPGWRRLTGPEAAQALGRLHLRCGAMAILQPPQSWIQPHGGESR